MEAADYRLTHYDIADAASEIEDDLLEVLNYLKQARGFDFSGCRPSMLHRRMSVRLDAVKCKNIPDYLDYLRKDGSELDNLIDALTINVSSFFRDPLVFEYLSEKIVPSILSEKTQISSSPLRLWSAGCATGEEPYSLAILINELLKKEGQGIGPNIFATDIDRTVLRRAKVGEYAFDSVKNVKLGLLKAYFTEQSEHYRVIPEIRSAVTFSMFDLLDKKCRVPSESVFGDFDIVSCRNVLIYFNHTYQKIIFEKLYRCLTKQGYLVLGTAETPIQEYSKCFRRVADGVNIYQKTN